MERSQNLDAGSDGPRERADSRARRRHYLPVGGALVGLAVLLGVGYGIWKTERFGAAVITAVTPNRSVTTEVTPFSGVEMMRIPGGVLEVAQVKAYERITRKDSLKVLKDFVDLGTTVSEIDVPVLLRYHVEMAQEWPVVCDKGSCVVQAPKLLPSLPPGVYSAEIRKRTEGGWARFNKDENLVALERSLTSELSERAKSDRNMVPATEAGRKTIQEFARTWMMKHRVKPGEPTPTIDVLFPGEKQGAGATPVG